MCNLFREAAPVLNSDILLWKRFLRVCGDIMEFQEGERGEFALSDH